MEAAIGLPAECDWWSGATPRSEANFLSALGARLADGTPGRALHLAGGAGLALLLPRPPRHRARTARPDPAGGRGSSHPTTPSPRRWSPQACWRGRSARSAAARIHLQRGLAISESGRDRRRTAVASSFLGHIARTEGRFADAAAHHEPPRSSTGAIRSVSGYAWTRYDLGLLALRGGDRAAAVRELRDGLALFRRLDYGWAIGRYAWALATARLHRPGARRGGRAAGGGARPAPGGR